MRSLLLVLSSLLLSGSLAAESVTYTGTYDWLDFPPDSIGEKTMSMTLTKTDAGYDVTFTANFQTEQFGGQFKDAKNYDYKGSLVEDETKTYLTGKITEPDGKRFWHVDLKLNKDRAIGFAKETEGYKTWGSFNLSKAK